MCVSPAIGGVTIKARHMEAKDRFWSLASIVTTPLANFLRHVIYPVISYVFGAS